MSQENQTKPAPKPRDEVAIAMQKQMLLRNLSMAQSMASLNEPVMVETHMVQAQCQLEQLKKLGWGAETADMVIELPSRPQNPEITI